MFNITNIPEVKVYKIAENTAIVDVQYNTRYELCSAFMRVQEFYESDIPCIKDHYFTILIKEFVAFNPRLTIVGFLLTNQRKFFNINVLFNSHQIIEK